MGLDYPTLASDFLVSKYQIFTCRMYTMYQWKFYATAALFSLQVIAEGAKRALAEASFPCCHQ